MTRDKVKLAAQRERYKLKRLLRYYTDEAYRIKIRREARLRMRSINRCKPKLFNTQTCIVCGVDFLVPTLKIEACSDTCRKYRKEERRRLRFSLPEVRERNLVRQKKWRKNRYDNDPVYRAKMIAKAKEWHEQHPEVASKTSRRQRDRLIAIRHIARELGIKPNLKTCSERTSFYHSMHRAFKELNLI